MDAGSVVKAQTWRLFVLQKGHQIRSNCISVQLGRRELREHMLVEWYLVVKTHYNTGCHKCVPIIRVGGTLSPSPGNLSLLQTLNLSYNLFYIERIPSGLKHWELLTSALISYTVLFQKHCLIAQTFSGSKFHISILLVD